MASSKKTTTSSISTPLLKLAGPAAPFQLVQTSSAAQSKPPPVPQAVPADPSDPTGVKSYISFSVTHGIYPQGAGINPDQDISDDVKLNPDTIAAEVNVDAQHAATIHQFIWTSVTSDQIGKLNKVSDLVTLIKTNLKDAPAARPNK